MNVALRRLETVAPAAAILIGLLVVWELIARLAAVPEWLLPAPTRIVVEFVESAPILGPHLTRTILEAALGYTVATAAAMPVVARAGSAPTNPASSEKFTVPNFQ